MLGEFRKFLGDALVPVARAWIRHSPIAIGKRWLWERAHWRHRQFTAKTRHGLRVTGNTEDLIQRYLYYFGIWEPNITNWISSTLKSGDGFVDVGANIGYYSLLASRLVGSDGNVVAIEAADPIHVILEKHIRLNRLGNVRTVLAAAAETRGVARVYLAGADNIGATKTTTGRPGVPGTEVAALPLCDILREDEIARARIIKIDVEGAEVSVVRGLAPVLDRLRPDAEILIEISPALMTDPGHSTAEIFSIMRGHGFSAFLLDNDYEAESYLAASGIKRPVPLAGAQVGSQADVIFSRARH
jgi:FkbM family methyltransferase